MSHDVNWEGKGLSRSIRTILCMETATTQEEFEAMHKAIDELHSAYNNVYVDARALKNILYDHAQFCGLPDDLNEFLEVKHGTVTASQEAQYCYEKYRDITGFIPEEIEDELTDKEDT